MKSKRILMLSSEYPNADKSSNIYTDLAQALRKSGYNVCVVIPEESKNIERTQLFLENKIEVLRVKVGNLYNVNLFEKGITFLKSGFLLRKAISKYFKDKSFDLILFMSQPVTIAKTVKYAMKRYKCPSYLMMKDIFPQNAVDIGIIKKSNPIYWYFRFKEKQLYKIATTIGCMSKQNIKYLISNNTYLAKQKFEIFPNTQKVSKNVEKNFEYNLRTKYNIPKDKVLAVYGGNLGKPQGIDFFIKVLEAYKNNDKINFLIISRGTEKEKVYKYINNSNIKNVYKFDLMPREDYQKILLECDIGLIFLDKRFTIPNYPSKALAYFDIAVPIMAGIDVNNDFKEMIEISKSGFWAESDNIDKYKEKFDRLIEDESLRKKMGQNGRKYFEENFDVNKSVDIINKYVNGRKGEN